LYASFGSPLFIYYLAGMYRQKHNFLILSILFFCGCASHDEQVVAVWPDALLAWDINADSLVMKRDITIPDSAITIRRVINGLNEKYPEVKLVLLRQGHDTVYTRVPDSDFLGEQMGSAGAAAWYADAVINLASVPGIHYVSFSMQTQSHAASSVISLENYRQWKRQ
jgi:hypothetical protein